MIRCSPFNESIRSAFSFSEEERSANASGLLSLRQKEMLSGYVKSRGCGTRSASVAIGLTAALMLGLFLLITEPESPGFRQAMPYMIGTWTAFLLIFTFFMILGRIRSRDLQNGRVSTAEGEISTWKKEYSHGTALYARVGGIRFQLHSAEQMEVLSRNSSYRIHYISNPPAHVVLSLEVLG